MTDYPRPARGRKESVDSLFLIGWTPGPSNRFYRTSESSNP
jgi:hypothetical protein